MKGRRRGLPREAYRLFRWAVGLLMGCGLYSLANQLLSGLFPDLSGFGGFLLGFGGALLLVRTVKVRLIQTLERRYPAQTASRAGLIAGAVRGAIIVTSLATTAHVAPFFPWKDAITQSSLLGTVTGVFFGEAVESPAETGQGEDASESRTVP